MQPRPAHRPDRVRRGPRARQLADPEASRRARPRRGPSAVPRRPARRRSAGTGSVGWWSLSTSDHRQPASVRCHPLARPAAGRTKGCAPARRAVPTQDPAARDAIPAPIDAATLDDHDRRCRRPDPAPGLRRRRCRDAGDRRARCRSKRSSRSSSTRSVRWSGRSYAALGIVDAQRRHRGVHHVRDGHRRRERGSGPATRSRLPRTDHPREPRRSGSRTSRSTRDATGSRRTTRRCTASWASR